METELADTLSQAGPELTSLGKHIEMLRIARGISKQHLARAVGTSRQQLWRVMTGKAELAGSLRARLSDALGVQPGALVDAADHEPPFPLIHRDSARGSELDQMVLRLAAAGDRRASPPFVDPDVVGSTSIASYLAHPPSVERTLRTIPGGPEGLRVRRALLDALEEAALGLGLPMPPQLFDLRRRVLNDEL